MSEEIILMCAPADSEMVVPGSVFDKKCSVCGRSVMIAPTGQAMLLKFPEAVIVCFCQMDNALKAEHHAIAGSRGEVVEEIRAAIPNLRRTRN